MIFFVITDALNPKGEQSHGFRFECDVTSLKDFNETIVRDGMIEGVVIERRRNGETSRRKRGLFAGHIISAEPGAIDRSKIDR